MPKFDIVIQKTTAGLSLDYHTQGIDPVNDPEIKRTISDEREYSTQLASNTDVFSLQITDKYRVYSVIVSELDTFSRPGFYEIKLYSPINLKVTGFVEILQKIKAKYLAAGDKSSHDFSEILSELNDAGQERNEEYSYVGKNIKNCYYYFNSTAEINALALNDNVFLVNKVYGLQEGKISSKNVAEELGLAPFEENISREVFIKNPDGVLNGIYVNDQKLDLLSFRDGINLLIQKGDIVTYSTHDGITKRVIHEDEIVIKRKWQPQPLPANRTAVVSKKQGSFQGNLIYIVLTLIMAGTGYFAYVTFFESPASITDNSYPKGSLSGNNDKDQFSFNFIKQENRYASDKLDTIVFVFQNSTWKYGVVDQAIFHVQAIIKESDTSNFKADNSSIFNGQGEIDPRTKDSIAKPSDLLLLTNEVFKSFNLSEDKENSFRRELERLSGEAIDFVEQKDVNKSEENQKMEEIEIETETKNPPDKVVAIKKKPEPKKSSNKGIEENMKDKNKTAEPKATGLEDLNKIKIEKNGTNNN
jgi:hypothetical protein